MTQPSKTVVITTEFTKCRNCPYVRNTAMDHDDPFTSTPIPIWYCCHPKNVGVKAEFVIQDINQIDTRCPL